LADDAEVGRATPYVCKLPDQLLKRTQRTLFVGGALPGRLGPSGRCLIGDIDNAAEAMAEYFAYCPTRGSEIRPHFWS
jgi:hypothetical protein